MNSIQPVDHTDTDNDDVPPGGSDTDVGGVQKGPGPAYQNELDAATENNTILTQTDQRASSDHRYGEYEMNAYGNVYLDPLRKRSKCLGMVVSPSHLLRCSSHPRSSSAPVFCEIRPTVNGVPAAGKMFASKKLSPSQVNGTRQYYKQDHVEEWHIVHI